MGGLMGLMMLRMAHGVIAQESGLAGPVLVVFILGHFVAVGVLAALLVWSARYAPALRARLDRFHRPSLRHIGGMIGFAMAAASAAHLILHGGF
jgi:hypothetical protein